MKSNFLTLKGLRRFFLITCVIFTARIVYIQYGIYTELKEAGAEINQEIEFQLARQEELRLELEYSLSDENIEKVAREQLGFVKSNEIIFVNTNN